MVYKPRTNLSSFVSWSLVLSCCDINVPVLALPQKNLLCPICKTSRLSILYDNSAASQWFCCYGCGNCGDPIKFAAQVWDTSIANVVRRLTNAGCNFPADLNISEAIEYYIRHRLETAAKFEQFWDISRNANINHFPQITSKLANLGWTCKIDPEYYHKGPAHLIGFTIKDEIDSITRPSDKKFKKRDGTFAVKNSILPENWTETIILPLCELPRKVTGFLFFGGNFDPVKDIVAYQCSPAVDSRNDRELGLWFHPKLVSGPTKAVIAINDLNMAVRLQMRSMTIKQKPIPVVYWHDTGKRRPKHAWDMFSPKEIVFWSKVITPQLLMQVMGTDFNISSVSVAEAAPEDMIRRIYRAKQPWRSVLNYQMVQMSDEYLEDLVFGFMSLGGDIGALLNDLSAENANRIQLVLSDQPVCKAATFEARRIEEREDGWYVCRTVGPSSKIQAELISDAILRIDAIVIYRKTDQVFYRGRILYDGNELEFCEPASVVENNTLKWMRDFGLKHKIGPIRISQSWSNKAVTIAQRFHKPKLVDGIDTVGWNDAEASFIFPKFRIGIGGRVAKHDNIVIDATTPAQALPEPLVLNPDEISALTKPSKQNELFWCIWCCLVRNILCPIKGKQPRGIAVSGHVAQSIAMLAKASCGCVDYTIPKDVESLLVTEQEANWPIAVNFATVAVEKRLRDYLSVSGKPRNCMATVDWLNACIIRLNDEWDVIDSADSEDEVTIRLTDCLSLLPHYLRDLQVRRLNINQQRGSFTNAVFKDIAKWITRTGNDSTVVMNSYCLIKYIDADKRSVDFLKIIHHLLRDGSAAVLPHTFVKHKNAIWRIPNDEFGTKNNALFIPRSLIISELKARNKVELNLEKVREHLIDDNYLWGEAELNGKFGFIISERYIKGRLKQFGIKGVPGLHNLQMYRRPGGSMPAGQSLPEKEITLVDPKTGIPVKWSDERGQNKRS